MMPRNGSIPDYEYSPGVLAHRVGELEDRADKTDAAVERVEEEQRSTAKELAVLTGQIRLGMKVVPAVCAGVTIGAPALWWLFQMLAHH